MIAATAIIARWIGVLLLLTLCRVSMAATDVIPVVRVEVTPQVVTVGEVVSLRVTILTPTWFPKPPLYPGFELPNAVTRLPADSSYPTSARVNGETWSGIVREYQIYPLLGANFVLADRVIGVTYADPDTSQPLLVEVAVPRIEVRAEVPAGAENLNPYIAGDSFTLTREIEGDLATLQAGDALVLRYSAELEGLPSMFLPALTRELVAASEVDGLQVYVDTPVLTDAHPATRTEVATLVFEAGGEFTLPQLTFDWWNSEAGVVASAVVPELHISVLGPVIDAKAPERVFAVAVWRWVIAMGVALVVAGLAWRWYGLLSGQFKRYREARILSEKYAFNGLINSLGNRDPKVVYALLVDWLHRQDPGVDLYQFAWSFGNEELTQQIERLTRTNFDKDSAVLDWNVLRKNLVAARNKSLQKIAVVPQTLPPLNP